MYVPISMKRSTKYGNTYLRGFSPKIGRIVTFFSELEYDNWLHIECNPKIISFCEQPLKIKTFFNGEYVESIPDMWVKYLDGTEEFMEVKYSEELKGNSKKALRSIRQVEAQKQWCKENNFKFSLMTELDIRKDLIYLNNLKQIVGNVRCLTKLNNNDLEQIIALLSSKPLSISTIVNSTTFNTSYIIQMISLLIYEGKCEFINPNTYLGLETEVYLLDSKENI